MTPSSGSLLDVKRLDQRLMGLELRRRFLMSGERKRDARQKLLLGGLVVRAGLAEADRAFLLGALLELVKVSLTSDGYRRLREIGETALKAFLMTRRHYSWRRRLNGAGRQNTSELASHPGTDRG